MLCDNLEGWDGVEGGRAVKEGQINLKIITFPEEITKGMEWMKFIYRLHF